MGRAPKKRTHNRPLRVWCVQGGGVESRRFQAGCVRPVVLVCCVLRAGFLAKNPRFKECCALAVTLAPRKLDGNRCCGHTNTSSSKLNLHFSRA